MFRLLFLFLSITAVPCLADVQEYRECRNLINETNSFTKLKKLAGEKNYPVLIKAIDAAKKLPRRLGISKRQFLLASAFIETRLQEFVNDKKYFLTSQKTKLSHRLEYDPMTEECFIILEGKKNKIGEGAFKVVQKAIAYNKGKPQVVAQAVQRVRSLRELDITKKLHGKPGIFETLGFGRHKEKGKNHISIYSRMYNHGSLQDVLDAKMKFSLKQKLKMALNMMKGVESMHKLGIVHRDLGARNYLVNIAKGKKNIEACVADLGRADYAKNVAGSKVQGNTKYTPPEGLYRNKMKSKDYYAADVYAIGCVLFRLYYEKLAPWQDRSYVKDTRSIKTRYDELVYRINEVTRPRSRFLARKMKKGSLSPKYQFEKLILRMISQDPKKRGSSRYLSSRLEEILKEC